jgi:hypothetical protein
MRSLGAERTGLTRVLALRLAVMVEHNQSIDSTLILARPESQKDQLQHSP